jgi:ubiquitin C-terminal hydrolase
LPSISDSIFVGLDVREHFDICDGQPAPVYNLVAICNHKGSLNGGHYFSYARSSPTGQLWISLNDQQVKTVRNSSLISNQAYVLFYERVSSE